MNGVLTPRQQKLMERVTLELYCQYELSLPLREAAADRAGLDAIRARLQPASPQRYRHVHAFVAECRQLFRGACQRLPVRPSPPCRPRLPAAPAGSPSVSFVLTPSRGPQPESQMYKDTKRLEEFFDLQLAKWLPEFAFWSGEGEPPVKRPRMD